MSLLEPAAVALPRTTRTKRATALSCLIALAAAMSCAPVQDGGSELTFEVDASWPRPFPHDWILGQVTGLTVDGGGHVWVVHQTNVLTPDEAGAVQNPPIATCCVPAPEVLELDANGDVVQAWSAAGDESGRVVSPHGILVDHENFVWIASNSAHRIMKFSRDGAHLMTIGELNETGGSNDRVRVGGPAAMFRYPGSDELFVADGYRNRRVVVYDANTGAYLRHWGAYGERPDDGYEHPGHDAENPSAQFAVVHGIVGSSDGYLYVADRSNNRIQVFRTDGSFVTERIVMPATLASGSAFSLALSPDDEQTFLFLADGTNHLIHVLRRADLEVLTSFGGGGRQAGQFIRVHNVAVDADGNVYTGEAGTGRRIQRFRPSQPEATR